MWINSALQDINARSIGRTLNKALEDFTIAGSIISMLGLALAIVTMVGFKWGWSEPKSAGRKLFERKTRDGVFKKGIQTNGANVIPTLFGFFWNYITTCTCFLLKMLFHLLLLFVCLFVCFIFCLFVFSEGGKYYCAYDINMVMDCLHKLLFPKAVILKAKFAWSSPPAYYY